MRWIINNLLWDTKDSTRRGLFQALWATRKLLLALVATTLLTWGEWVEHHPPDIVVVALIRFVFVLAAIAVIVFIAQRFGLATRRGRN